MYKYQNDSCLKRKDFFSPVYNSNNLNEIIQNITTAINTSKILLKFNTNIQWTLKFQTASKIKRFPLICIQWTLTQMLSGHKHVRHCPLSGYFQEGVLDFTSIGCQRILRKKNAEYTNFEISHDYCMLLKRGISNLDDTEREKKALIVT